MTIAVFILVGLLAAGAVYLLTRKKAHVEEVILTKVAEVKAAEQTSVNEVRAVEQKIEQTVGGVIAEWKADQLDVCRDFILRKCR